MKHINLLPPQLQKEIRAKQMIAVSLEIILLFIVLGTILLFIFGPK